MYYIIFIFILSLLTILAANQYYFPNSKFAELSSLVLFNATITTIALSLLFAACGIMIFLALAGLLYRLRRHLIITLISCFIIFMLYEFLFKSEERYQSLASSSRPNIILIGMDSLRPDFLSYSGFDRKTPYLDSFLEQSTVFAEAVTPLARTFPSWSSLLTGQYPRELNIRSNLSSQKQLRLDATLSSILKQNGYETIYATDETRFSNIDRNFGFDRIISPPMGLNDFLIGNFNDFPLSNLLINTLAGKWLFPHSYANRPRIILSPDIFALLKPVLEEIENPVFSCFSTCPYLWASFLEKVMPQNAILQALAVSIHKLKFYNYSGKSFAGSCHHGCCQTMVRLDFGVNLLEQDYITGKKVPCFIKG